MRPVGVSEYAHKECRVFPLRRQVPTQRLPELKENNVTVKLKSQPQSQQKELIRDKTLL